MSKERLFALYSFGVAVALAFILFRISRNPQASALGRWTVKALDSWYLRARWSDDPSIRITRMAWAAIILAVLMLFGFLFNPPLRY